MWIDVEVFAFATLSAKIRLFPSDCATRRLYYFHFFKFRTFTSDGLAGASMCVSVVIGDSKSVNGINVMEARYRAAKHCFS